MKRTRPETTEAMEIFDERGLPLGSVTRPTDSGLFGLDKGTVFLNRTPALGLAPQGPARAA